MDRANEIHTKLGSICFDIQVLRLELEVYILEISGL